MARHSFAADPSSWVFTIDGTTGAAEPLAGAVITFWNQQTGGTQYTDLAAAADGSGSTTTITSGDGSGGTVVGSIPQFYGPNNVWGMWGSANGGPRQLFLASDLATYVQANTDTVATVQAGLSAHLAATNPHAVRLGDLTDANVGSATNGQLLSWDTATSKWVPVTIGGVSGTVLLATDQTITGTKTWNTGDVNKSTIVLLAQSGQVSDLMQAWSGAAQGQGGSPQRTFYLNEKGELRVITAKSDSVGVRIKGQTGQTAHVLEQTDISNNPISWWEPNGSWRAPNLGHTFAFSLGGVLSVGTGTHRIYNDTGVDLQIRSVRASVGTAPSGSAVTCDVNINGTTIFSTQSNRPSIAAAGNTSGRITNMNTTAFTNGQYLTIDIDAIGSGTAGSDLVVQVLAY